MDGGLGLVDLGGGDLDVDPGVQRQHEPQLGAPLERPRAERSWLIVHEHFSPFVANP